MAEKKKKSKGASAKSRRGEYRWPTERSRAKRRFEMWKSSPDSIAMAQSRRAEPRRPQMRPRVIVSSRLFSEPLRSERKEPVTWLWCLVRCQRARRRRGWPLRPTEFAKASSAEPVCETLLTAVPCNIRSSRLQY